MIRVGLGLLTISVYYVYHSYRQSLKPSKYMLVAQKLGLIGHEQNNGDKVTVEEEQEALLQIFHLAGYFTSSNIWEDLNRIGHIEHLEEVFEEFYHVIRLSHGDQPNPALFNAKYLRKNLFNSDHLDFQDVLDLILYIGQHAFNRNIGQERNELKPQKWIETYSDEYRRAAQRLRLIDRKNPSSTEYDQCWIAGSSRPVLMQRIIDFNYNLVRRNLKIHGETLILAGERELWAQIDGISPELAEKLHQASENNADVDTISTNDESLNDGQSYMKRLAEMHNIKLNSSKPFIEYQNKEECPSDRFSHRIYANYQINEVSKLTETLMSYDIWKTFSSMSCTPIHVIDTASQEQTRPTTSSTARDATERFVQSILAGDYGEKKTFVILFCSNNPYIERQTLATQEQVNLVLEKSHLPYEIQIDGVGYCSKQQLTVVHSELGALIGEKWKKVVEQIKPKREKKDLFFQTRAKNIPVKQQPTVDKYRLYNLVKYFFDLYLR